MKTRWLLILTVSATLPAANAAPITAIAPSCAAVGTQVTLIGTGFDAGGLALTVDGLLAKVAGFTKSRFLFAKSARISHQFLSLARQSRL